ncbi:MAG TPA: Imm10 family immunity protein [Candidatus Limnocylindrales bacterium]|nr:Imm10 family immunity protein [Candidatus Limnocylindrales bacterium]
MVSRWSGPRTRSWSDTFRLVGESDDDNVYVIGLAEHSDGGGRSLTLSLDPDEDDVDAGFDIYCLVLDPGQHKFYGGIAECVLDQQQLHLRLTPEAATTVGIDPVLCVHLHLEPAQHTLLRDGLHRTLTGGRPTPDPTA